MVQVCKIGPFNHCNRSCCLIKLLCGGRAVPSQGPDFLVSAAGNGSQCHISSHLCALAYDPDMLQDLCVANTSAGIKVNGFTCKAETNITEADFFFSGLAKTGKVNISVGSLVTGANVEQIPGLNTLGVSLSRIDYAPEGLNPPHTHPRATEMIFVLEGELAVGFITTANKLISKTVKKGEIFVFPRGLVHFQKNNGDKAASVISAFNSQLPGTQSIAMTLFTSTPVVPDSVLTIAFQIGTKEIDKIKTKLAPKKS